MIFVLIPGTEWSRKFSEATPLEVMNMEHEFEKCKIAIGSEEIDETIQLPLPCSVRESFRDGRIQLANQQTQIFNNQTGRPEI